jgi:hypothetical protein
MNSTLIVPRGPKRYKELILKIRPKTLPGIIYLGPPDRKFTALRFIKKLILFPGDCFFA